MSTEAGLDIEGVILNFGPQCPRHHEEMLSCGCHVDLAAAVRAHLAEWLGSGEVDPERAAEARLVKYGSTLNAHNVQKVCERIEDYPEILNAVAEALGLQP